MKITIVKGVHLGIKNAKLLLPYILETDVYSPENAKGTEEESSAHETFWLNILNSGISRSGFNELSRGLYKDVKEEQKKFLLTVGDYLFRSKIPLWYLERFTKKRIGDIDALLAESNRRFDVGKEFFRSGKEDQALELYWRSYEPFMAACRIRDVEVARNLDGAEVAIRGKYPLLKEVEPLRLLVQVGMLHSPEKYTSIPVEAISLLPKTNTAEDRLCEGIIQGRSFDELRPDLIEMCRLEFAEQ